ncbi:MAG: hypothetical protein Q9M75_09955, partial [Ghiorsea sp.]|nr:hypothetical protein [Ghiorsea sp.]
MPEQNHTPPCRAPLYPEGNNITDNVSHSPSSMKGWQPKADKVNAIGREYPLGDGVDAFLINEHKVPKRYTANLPLNSKLKDKAKALCKAGVLSEVLFWQQVHHK